MIQVDNFGGIDLQALLMGALTIAFGFYLYTQLFR